ncbi:MAG TPA: hypothetical protein VIG47_14610 [Gemmatimonadaceae bacterium]
MAPADEVLESGADAGVLLLDLGSCCNDETLCTVVRTWDAYGPGSEFVVVAPLLDRDCELRLAIRFSLELRFAQVRVLTASGFYRDEGGRCGNDAAGAGASARTLEERMESSSARASDAHLVSRCSTTDGVGFEPTVRY